MMRRTSIVQAEYRIPHAPTRCLIGEWGLQTETGWMLPRMFLE